MNDKWCVLHCISQPLLKVFNLTLKLTVSPVLLVPLDDTFREWKDRYLFLSGNCNVGTLLLIVAVTAFESLLLRLNDDWKSTNRRRPGSFVSLSCRRFHDQQAPCLGCCKSAFCIQVCQYPNSVDFACQTNLVYYFCHIPASLVLDDKAACDR